MNFPENISLLHIAIALFSVGLFLFISGLDILKLEKIQVLTSVKTWVIGLCLMIIGTSVGVYDHKKTTTKKDKKCEVGITSHKDDDNVTRTIRIKGKSTNCLKDKLYTLVLEDKDGDYYKQNDMKLMTGGDWSSFISLGSVWSKKPVVIKVVGYTENTTWIEGDNKLPDDVFLYSEVELNVE